MIIVFNGVAWGFVHVPFDVAFLASLSHAFPTERIQFFGEREHVAQVQTSLERCFPEAPVICRELSLPPANATPVARIADDFRIARSIAAEARRSGARRIIACYAHAITGTLALKALAATSGAEIAIVHHGNFMRLVLNRRYRPLLTSGIGRLRHIVLGESIRAEVLARVPGMARSLSAIRHPYVFDQAMASELPTSGPVRFSFLGLIGEMKGYPKFVELATELVPPQREAIHFDQIGGRLSGELETLSPWVTTYTRSGPLARTVFDAKLRETSYTLFPYDPEFYKLIPSGSVLDALTAGKPVIALRNSQFEELFGTMGDIGYLCSDMHEMRRLVADIVRIRPSMRYQQQSRNILARREVFSPAAVGRQLREVLA